MLELELIRAETASEVELFVKPLRTLLRLGDAEAIALDRVDMGVDAFVEVCVPVYCLKP
jgi:hypothetical protein